MSVEQMKKAILDVYPGKKWENKVKYMNEDQVIAVYYRFLNGGKLNAKR